MAARKFFGFNILVLCVWIGILSFFLYQTYWGVPFEKTAPLDRHFKESTVWYAIYRDNKKVGSAKSYFQTVGDEIIIGKESTMNAPDEEMGDGLKLGENLRCLCNKDYTIKSFTYSLSRNDRNETTVEGRLENDLVVFFIEQGGKKQVRRVPMEGRTVYLPPTLIPAIHQQKPAPGSMFRTTFIDIMNTRLFDTSFSLDEIVPIEVGVDIKSVYKYNVSGSFIWTREDGSVIKEQYPSGIQLYAQPESIALEREGRPIFDYTSLPFFKANRLIPDPEAISAMTVLIEGFPPETLRSENFVKALPDKTFVIHKLTREDLQKASYTLPSTDESATQYLEPDDWVSSGYGPLKKTGKIYAGANNNDAFELTSYLTSYVHNLIKTSPQFPLRDSATILDHREGNYIEKTLMFATYARAGGLPTRLIGGLVYRNGYFFFHTWPEIWIGKWAPVDPALYQLPADATHIPLITGSLTDIISIIDKLKSINLEILEVS